MKPFEIAQKYVYGEHDALTDNQEIIDMTKDIEQAIAEQLILSGVSKSFTYKDISKVAEDLANEYCGDTKDPVWQDIKQDGIKAIQAFISKHL